ncbi:hypothetical protein D3C73_1411430 [compost metagenome]
MGCIRLIEFVEDSGHDLWIDPASGVAEHHFQESRDTLHLNGNRFMLRCELDRIIQQIKPDLIEQLLAAGQGIIMKIEIEL